MKKTTKTIIATLLALTLAFCSIPAFAHGIGQTIHWEDKIHTYADPYTYMGEITEGKTYIEATVREACCKLDLEKEGFYLFSYDAEEVREINISESIYNGAPCGWADVLRNAEEGRSVVYVPDSETYVGVDLIDGVEGAEITVSYYDSAIADIEFEDGAFDELLFAADFELTEQKNVVKMELDAEITFENGEVYTLERGDFTVEADEAISRGKYDTTVKYHAYSEETELDVRLASDYIKKVEITNIEKYLRSVRYYDGSVVSAFDNGGLEKETMTITFWNGTTEVIEGPYNYGYIGLPNGRHYEIQLDALVEGNTSTFVVDVAGQYLLARECKFREASFAENLISLIKYVNLQLEDINYQVKSTFAAVAQGKVPATNLIKLFSSEFMKMKIGFICEDIRIFNDYYTSAK